jgi:hypothetical protein
MLGFKRAPEGTEGDTVSSRREKWVVAGVTLALGAGLVVSTLHQGDRTAQIRALQARVDQLNAKQAAARKRVDEVTDQYPGDPKFFEISKQAGWLTPDEWAEWQRLQIEIEDLGGTASWDDGSSRPIRPATARAQLGSASTPNTRHSGTSASAPP